MHFRPFLLLAAIPALSSLVFAALASSIVRSLDSAPVLHFSLSRRGGLFAGTQFPTDIVNLTYLAEELKRVESRFNLTRRVVKGNRLVRKAKLDETASDDGGLLMGKIADDGLWYVSHPSSCVENGGLRMRFWPQVCKNQDWRAITRS